MNKHDMNHRWTRLLIIFSALFILDSGGDEDAARLFRVMLWFYAAYILGCYGLHNLMEWLEERKG